MTETEAVLLSRFTDSGDAEAFAEIIRRHAGLVYGTALRILADVDRAADVCQETFLQLTKDPSSVTGSLPGWLHLVATHKAIDQRRRDESRRHREREYVSRERPREASDWKEISSCIDVELRELDPQLREVLILHFLEGRTTREIARAQGTSPATISRRIGSGVEQLHAKLQRRGLIVAVGALSTLLGNHTVQAAPLLLRTELGKMALISGTPGTAGNLTTAAGGIAAAVRTHAMTAAAVAIVGAGSVITYQQVVKPIPRPPVIAPARSTVPSVPRRAIRPSLAPRNSPVPVTESSMAAQEWDGTRNTAAGSERETPPPQGSDSRPKVARAVPPKAEPQTGQHATMGSAVGAATPEENSPEEKTQPPGTGIFGATVRVRPFGLPDDPNDPNASGRP